MPCSNATRAQAGSSATPSPAFGGHCAAHQQLPRTRQRPAGPNCLAGRAERVRGQRGWPERRRASRPDRDGVDVAADPQVDAVTCVISTDGRAGARISSSLLFIRALALPSVRATEPGRPGEAGRDSQAPGRSWRWSPRTCVEPVSGRRNRGETDGAAPRLVLLRDTEVEGHFRPLPTTAGVASRVNLRPAQDHNFCAWRSRPRSSGCPRDESPSGNSPGLRDCGVGLGKLLQRWDPNHDTHHAHDGNTETAKK